ncbi:MAG: tRNA preQ1(34) S-adenosylmethionine ribosyltransferase-isomerase QueA, partial [Syntrophomonadaceae bacterium]|nr:tRNA preQ1(34) S-adenosylmethionine ribosyltransferase-isomerase QueA [Syntrophomonadaceae bacterium]
MQVSEFDYQLPEELIAQEPLPTRDLSRLLVVHRASCCLEHRHFRDLADYLNPGDCLVLNATKVFPARLKAWNSESGGELEVFLLRPRDEMNQWEALVRPGRRAKIGSRLRFTPRPEENQVRAEVLSRTSDGGRIIRFFHLPQESAGPLPDVSRLIQTRGLIPLPPYIRRPPREEDRERYQTVFARIAGSVAAPTAGLHFTRDLLGQLEQKGVRLVELVLHVGAGTFRPVRCDRVEDHRMHAEYYQLPAEAAELLNSARLRGGRIFAVGTTVARTLESRAGDDGLVKAGEGWTELFIYPGYRFKAVDALITNFHLPRSTLLMLVSAFA